MGRIKIEGMLFKSHIGVYSFEQQYGNNFEVDITIDSQKITGISDELHNTIDYDTIYTLVKSVMGNRYHLIEFAAKEMLDLIKNNFEINYLMVRVTKLHPPLGGEVNKVCAELEWKSEK